MNIEDYSDDELLQSIVAEIAKATAELKCAQGDVNKAQSRLKFALLAANIIKDRKDDK